MIQAINNNISKENLSKLKFIPLGVYSLLLVITYFCESFVVNFVAIMLLSFFLFEFFSLKISKIFRNLWNNGRFDVTNFLDNQCFFGLSNTAILFLSGYFFSKGYVQNVFLSIFILFMFLIIDRIIQAYICKNSLQKNCYPSCERFTKVFCYYTREQSSENDDIDQNESPEKPLHALVISIRVLLLSIVGISLYLLLDEGSDIKNTLTSSGIVAVAVGFFFRTQISSMLIGAKLFYRKAFHINDWIEVPGLNIDGMIREINSFSVVVENWDKTKTNIPIEKFSEYSFKNWQDLNKEGMRRIKRSILIDLNSIKELSTEEIEKLKEKKVLREYLENKESEVKLFNSSNTYEYEKKITNIGTYRAFIEAYLSALQKNQKSKKIAPHDDNDIRVMVRQKELNEYGLALEVYTFAATTNWKEFENIQSDIFDYLLVSLKDFDLKVFQLENNIKG